MPLYVHHAAWVAGIEMGRRAPPISLTCLQSCLLLCIACPMRLAPAVLGLAPRSVKLRGHRQGLGRDNRAAVVVPCLG
jgi:hypothetical protein